MNKIVITFFISLFTSFVAIAQQSNLKVTYAWLTAKTIYSGTVYIDPETNEQSSGVHYQLALYIKVKKGSTINFTEAVYNTKRMIVSLEKKSSTCNVGTVTKTAKNLQLNAGKDYEIWQITLGDLVDEFDEKKPVAITLIEKNSAKKYFLQKAIFISGTPAE